MSFSLRPPWPDELRRLSPFLSSQSLGPGWHPRVWEVPRPARFVGAASWFLEPKTSSTLAFFQLLPRYHTPALALEMLRPLFAEISAAGAHDARLILRNREKWESLLRPFGIVWQHCDESWSGDPAICRARLAASPLLRRADKLAGWSVRPIADADWPVVSSWCVDTGFMTREHFDTLRARHSPELSGLAISPRGPAGFLFATLRGATGVIEFLGANPALRSASAIASHLLLRRFVSCDAPALAFDSVFLTTNPAKGRAAQSLARRCGLQLAQTHHHFHGPLKTLPS